MPGNIISRLIAIVITTFVIAMVYGLFLTTEDFMQPDYNPVASGHHAASNIYGLFGTVSDEIKTNDTKLTHTTSIARKIATPYAITADLSAILGGKLELSMSSFFHSNETHTL